MGYKMKRNAGSPFNFGEGTGRSPLKHDPDGLYAAKEKEKPPSPEEAKKKVKENVKEVPAKDKKHASLKDEPSEWDQFSMNPNAYISSAPGRISSWFRGK